MPSVLVEALKDLQVPGNATRQQVYSLAALVRMPRTILLCQVELVRLRPILMTISDYLYPFVSKLLPSSLSVIFT